MEDFLPALLLNLGEGKEVCDMPLFKRVMIWASRSGKRTPVSQINVYGVPAVSPLTPSLPKTLQNRNYLFLYIGAEPLCLCTCLLDHGEGEGALSTLEAKTITREPHDGFTSGGTSNAAGAAAVAQSAGRR